MKHPSCFFVYLALLMAAIAQGCHRNDKTADACGNFEAVDVIVSAQSQGELLTLNLQEGDTLSKGQRVGSIDSATAVIKHRQVLAQFEVSRAKMTNLDAQLNIQEQQRKILLREANRLDELLKQKAVSIEQVDNAVGQMQVLDAQTAALKTQRKIILGEIAVLEIQLDETINLLSKCRIVNPIDGTVLEKYTKAGEVVNPGKELYKIADMKMMELKAFVSGAQLSDFSVGDSTMVRINKGENNQFMIPGIICWVASEAEVLPETFQNRQKNVKWVYAIRVRVINDGKIKIGMPGEVIFHSETP